MKVLKVEFSRDLTLKPIADRWYEVQGDFSINVTTDCGVKRINVDDGFLFDGRSGGPMVDFIAPNLGTQDELKAWCFHDICGHDIIGLTFEETNDALYMLLRECGYGWVRAKIIYTAVSMSDDWFGLPVIGDRSYINITKIHVRHYDK